MSDVAFEPFHVYQAREDVRVPWHELDNGTRWHQAMGHAKSSLAEGATFAARQRLISLCAEDALGLHGDSLQWPQVPGESVDEYRARLLRSFALEEWRGSNKGIIDALTGILDIVVPSTAVRPADWVEVFESFTAGWGRQTGVSTHDRWFNVVIRHPHPFGSDFSFKWGDGTTWGGGKLYGVNGDPRLLELLRMTVRRMKPSNAYCEWVAIVLAGDIKHTDASTDGDPDTGAKVAYLKI